MQRWTYRIFIFFLCTAALSAFLCAQTERVITIRMIDGRTGKLVAISNYLVRVDHEQTVHANWVTQNEDGSGKLTLPRKASLLSIQGTYESAEQIYLNCDVAGDKNKHGDHWYDIATILSTGVSTPNGCAKPHDAAKLSTDARQMMVAKPGEFVFFVRKRNMLEQTQEDFADR